MYPAGFTQRFKEAKAIVEHTISRKDSKKQRLLWDIRFHAKSQTSKGYCGTYDFTQRSKGAKIILCNTLHFTQRFKEAKAIVGHTISRKEAKVQRLYCATHSISRKDSKKQRLLWDIRFHAKRQRCKDYTVRHTPFHAKRPGVKNTLYLALPADLLLYRFAGKHFAD